MQWYAEVSLMGTGESSIGWGIRIVGVSRCWMNEQMKGTCSGLLTMFPIFPALEGIKEIKAHFTWIYNWKDFSKSIFGTLLVVIKHFPSK